MKIYNTQQEVDQDINNEVLTIVGDVKFECSISILASIKIIKGNITARDINAWDINARDINARDINARDITAGDINARDINAWDITARDITAGDITARNILYYAFCCVYKSIKCFSIKAKKEIYQEPICLEGKLEIISKEKTPGKKIKIRLSEGQIVEGEIVD